MREIKNDKFIEALGRYVPAESSRELIDKIKLNTKTTFLFGTQVIFDAEAWRMVFLKKLHENLTIAQKEIDERFFNQTIR